MVMPAIESRPQVVEERGRNSSHPGRQVLEIPPQGMDSQRQIVEIQPQAKVAQPQSSAAHVQGVELEPTHDGGTAPNRRTTTATKCAAPQSATSVVVRARGYVPPQVYVAKGMTSDRLLETLTTHPLSVEREEAAVALGKCDWRTHPELPSALAKSAVADSSILVRCACMKSLATMHADTPEVRAALLRIRGEGHPALSEEAAKAFEQLSP